MSAGYSSRNALSFYTSPSSFHLPLFRWSMCLHDHWGGKIHDIFLLSLFFDDFFSFWDNFWTKSNGSMEHNRMRTVPKELGSKSDDFDGDCRFYFAPKPKLFGLGNPMFVGAIFCQNGNFLFGASAMHFAVQGA